MIKGKQHRCLGQLHTYRGVVSGTKRPKKLKKKSFRIWPETFTEYALRVNQRIQSKGFNQKNTMKTIKPKNQITLCGIALAIAALTTVPGYSQGKAEAALDAAKELGPKLHLLTSGYDRSAEITVRNHTNFRLVNIKTYGDSGKVTGLDTGKTIEAKNSGGVVALKSDGTATGAAGLISWDIEGTDRKLILMYSVPYDYNLYDNWFGIDVSFGPISIDEARFDRMYDDEQFAKRAGSQHTWQSGGGSATDLRYWHSHG